MKIKEECLFKPVMLFTTNGEILSLQNQQNISPTKIFLIVSKNERCVTLMHLDPCTTCLNKATLKPRFIYSIFEINAICGFHVLENVCVQNCRHCKFKFKDCVIGKVSIQPRCIQTIWKSNVYQQQYGKLQLCMDKESIKSIEIIVYHNNGNTYRYVGVDVIYLEQCKLIRIKSTSNKIIKGIFKMEMKNTVEIS